MTEAKSVHVTVTQRYTASAGRVFDAWLDPKMLAKFAFGPKLRDEEILHLKVDARIGGKFSFLVRRQGTDIDHVGTYFEMNRPRRLVFSWSAIAKGHADKPDDASRVAIDIAPRGKGCELTLTHTLPAKWVDYAERTQQGWTKMAAALGEALA